MFLLLSTTCIVRLIPLTVSLCVLYLAMELNQIYKYHYIACIKLYATVVTLQ